MRSNSFKFSLLCAAGLAILGLSGCFETQYLTEETAKRIASPAWLLSRTVPANGYDITVYERMHKRFVPANVYIEGDGTTWAQHRSISMNPTPMNPVALHLAAHDKATNVAYIARPCQYSDMNDPNKPCDKSIWVNARYSEEVLKTMSDTLDEMKKRYDITEFNLIGYDGGGAIATILAARRNDVASLRTVAGNLDHNVFSSYHDVEPLSNSLNAVDFADRLRNMPQHHFIGGNDEIMPTAVLHSYLQALGQTSCADYTFIQEAEHEAGFVEKWPELLTKMPSCAMPVRNFEQEPFQPPVIMERPKPEKP